MPAFRPSSAARRNPLFAAILACVLLLAMSACGGGGGGGGGDTTNDPPPDNNNDDDTIEPTLASIQENVFTPICTACHAGSSAPQGLRLEAGASYAMLVDVASVEVPELMRVDPGNPDGSYIIHKLEGSQAVGDRMPQGGPYLSQATIDAIRQWITDGAQDSGADGEGSDTPDYKRVATLDSAWPVADSVLDAPPARILLVADGELDASLLHEGSVQLVKLDDIDALTQAPRTMNASLRITSLAPTVIELRAPDNAWTNGRYAVRVAGSGAYAVADRAGRVIDGDADGEPGGDFVVQFDVERAQ